MDDPQDRNRQEYLQERKLLIDWERSSTTSFDKAMLTLSGGALGLSLTWVKEIGGAQAWKQGLKLSWLLFGVALLSTTWSFLVSQHALRRQRDILDDTEVSANVSKGNRAARNRWGSATLCLNWASVVAFTLGATSLLVYALSGRFGVEQ